MLSPQVFNELSPGSTGTSSYMGQVAFEFPMLGTTMALEGDYRHVQYPHNASRTLTTCAGPTFGGGCQGIVLGNGYLGTNVCPASDPGCVTMINSSGVSAATGFGQAYVAPLSATENDYDVHLDVKVFDPRVYIGGGYYSKTYNYLTYPNISGFGFGLTKLPDLDRTFSIYGSAWYYPSVGGNFKYPTNAFLGAVSGQTFSLTYSVLKYKAGAALTFGPVFLDLGYAGERFNTRSNAPGGTTVNAPYAGLGIKF